MKQTYVSYIIQVTVNYSTIEENKQERFSYVGISQEEALRLVNDEMKRRNADILKMDFNKTQKVLVAIPDMMHLEVDSE